MRPLRCPNDTLSGARVHVFEYTALQRSCVSELLRACVLACAACVGMRAHASVLAGLRVARCRLIAASPPPTQPGRALMNAARVEVMTGREGRGLPAGAHSSRRR